MTTETKKSTNKGSDRSSKDKGFFSSLYHFFNSIKLTVFLFIILGLVSMIGTVIEQGAEYEKYAQIYSEKTVRVFGALGLFDMYHSPWFFTLLLFLVTNITVCTIERLPRVLRFVRNVQPMLTPGQEKKYPFVERLRLGEDASARVEQTLKRYIRLTPWILFLDVVSIVSAVFLMRKYPMNFLEFVSFIVIPLSYVLLLNFPGKIHRTRENGTVYLFLNQWVLSRFGVYITHASILVIFLGAIIGSLFGFKGFMPVAEGETQNQMMVRQHRLIDSLSDSFGGSSNPEGQERHQQFKTLPFSIRCEDFSLTYYGDTRRPKDYKSELVVVRGGQEIARKVIEVNDPLIMDDIYFYQSSYGPTGRPGQVVLSVSRPGGEKREYRTSVNGSFTIEGTDTEIEVKSFIPDFRIMNGQVRKQSDEMINPAVYLIGKQEEKELFSGWMFPNYPDYNSLKTEAYDIQFVDYWGWQYTGLQVAYDPGVEIVWIGCSLMVVGLMIAFFHSHQRIWARVDGDEVVLAGSTHKDRMAFEDKFSQLAKQLKS